MLFYLLTQNTLVFILNVYRPVLLYRVPRNISISDIDINTSVEPDLTAATVAYSVLVEGSGFECVVEVLDKDGYVDKVETGMNHYEILFRTKKPFE